MEKNVSGVDAIVRWILAVVFLGAGVGSYLVYTGTWALLALLVGVLLALILGVTAYLRTCPLYTLLGWSTARERGT